jgi:hypothetical protein
MAPGLTIGSSEHIEFSFESREQRILSKLVFIGLQAIEDFEDRLGPDLVREIRSGLDEKTGAGKISGSPSELQRLMLFADLIAGNISLTVDENDIQPSSENYEFYSLFDSVAEQLEGVESAEVTIIDMLSGSQMDELKSVIEEYNKQMPSSSRFLPLMECLV